MCTRYHGPFKKDKIINVGDSPHPAKCQVCGESYQTIEHTEEGICPRCRELHGSQWPIRNNIECPYCHKSAYYPVTPQDPSGVSHGETWFCPYCGHEIFIVVYFDGGAYASKPSYYCYDCKKSTDSRKEMEIDHELLPNGLWKCKKPLKSSGFVPVNTGDWIFLEAKE
jgi:hypothetical protein